MTVPHAAICMWSYPIDGHASMRNMPAPTAHSAWRAPTSSSHHHACTLHADDDQKHRASDLAAWGHPNRERPRQFACGTRRAACLQRIVRLGGAVDDDMANLLVAQLLYLDSVDMKRDITMYVNSPGGSVTAGERRRQPGAHLWAMPAGLLGRGPTGPHGQSASAGCRSGC